MVTLLKKQQGFTLIELMIVVAIIGIIASIAIPGYRDYVTGSRWGKSIAITRALKLAVENCLSDTGGTFSSCDDLSDVKIGAYHVTTYAGANGEFLSIKLIRNTAAIEIKGDTPLSDCILTIKPTLPSGTGMIVWSYFMSSGSSLADNNKCKSFVKGTTVS